LCHQTGTGEHEGGREEAERSWGRLCGLADRVLAGRLPKTKMWYLTRPMALKLESRLIGRVVVLNCRGRITTGEETQALQQELTRLTLGIKNVVLGLAEVEFVDSGGIGTLVRIFRSLRAHGGDLKLCKVPESLLRVFQITHVHTVLEIYETEAQAVEAFRRRPGAEQEPAHGPKKTVLCVDQSHDVLAYLSVLLRRSGYEVMTTQSLADFARFLMATKPDGVIAGHGLQGNERVAEALRRAGPRVRVLFLPTEFSTAEASQAGRELVEQVGALFLEGKD
jgi:anti-sigma B factor antagonist